jgi:hypothetical protein
LPTTIPSPRNANFQLIRSNSSAKNVLSLGTYPHARRLVEPHEGGTIHVKSGEPDCNALPTWKSAARGFRPVTHVTMSRLQNGPSRSGTVFPASDLRALDERQSRPHCNRSPQLCNRFRLKLLIYNRLGLRIIVPV